jgi:maltose O-acetyltransferase
MRSYVLQFLFSILPDTRLYKLKAWLLRWRGFAIGSHVRIVSSVRLKLRHLEIGNNSFVGHDTMIAGGDAVVRIGRNVDIGPRCVIVTGTHEIGSAQHRAGEGLSLEIIVGDGTWIGAHSTILGGVHIGPGCVIGAGSLVCADVISNSLVAGVPARVIRVLTQPL